jgi:F-type H+-transporting ATPase subunit a
MYQVLEIFETHVLWCTVIGKVSIGLGFDTVVGSALLSFAIITFFFLFGFMVASKVFMYNINGTLYRVFYELVNNVGYEQMKDSVVFFRVFGVHIFIFIMVNNLIGLVPMGYPLTSQFVVTMFLSFTVCFEILLIGIFNVGYNLLYLFVPDRGTMPFLVAPFLGVVELVSYCARFISLGLRLFSNMMAGHSLMKILSGFTFSMYSFGFMFDLFVFLSFFVVFFVVVLEVGISVLQAYVFILLMFIYLHEVVHSGNLYQILPNFVRLNEYTFGDVVWSTYAAMNFLYSEYKLDAIGKGQFFFCVMYPHELNTRVYKVNKITINSPLDSDLPDVVVLKLHTLAVEYDTGEFDDDPEHDEPSLPFDVWLEYKLGIRQMPLFLDLEDDINVHFKGVTSLDYWGHIND